MDLLNKQIEDLELKYYELQSKYVEIIYKEHKRKYPWLFKPHPDKPIYSYWQWEVMNNRDPFTGKSFKGAHDLIPKKKWK